MMNGLRAITTSARGISLPSIITNQRYFSISRSTYQTSSSSSSKLDSLQPQSPSSSEQTAAAEWKKVAQLAESAAIEVRGGQVESSNKSLKLWNQALKSVGSPRNVSSSEIQDAMKKRTIIEQMENNWKKRTTYGLEKPFRPSDGRAMEVRNSDVARAMAGLNGLLRRNNVRHELRLGDRYEKPNQKRRRLASERHRRRFAHMVREKVQLIMHLKSRGA